MSYVLVVVLAGALAQTTLVLPPVPNVEPVVRAGNAMAPSGDLAGISGAFVGLRLGDAIGMALARNTDLALSQSNRRIAGYQIVAARGAYDLNLLVQPSLSYAANPALSTFQAGPGGVPATQTAAGLSAGLSGLGPNGGHFSIGTDATRINNTTTINGYDPYYQAALSVNYTQPLARGRVIDDARRAIRLSKINADSSTDAALLTASNTVSTVSNAYYDLVAAWRNVAIQEDALRQAAAQRESNARLVRGGAAARVDVVESDAQVQTFQDNVYSAIQNVARLQNQLKQSLLSDPADPIWAANLVPVSVTIDVPPEPLVDDVVAAALRTRPEVSQLRELLRTQDVNVLYARELTKPQVDLNLGAAQNGFAGQVAPAAQNPLSASTNTQIVAINQIIARVNANSAPGQTPLVPIALGPAVIPPYTAGGLGQAYNNLFSGRYPQYSVSATIGFPLRNRTAQANYRAALEQRRQVEIQEVALIQRVQTEARNAVQSYRSARSRLTAATAGRQAADAVAASELRKFRAGQSTTFLVLQRQVNRATQRGRELQAQTDLQKALVELSRVNGTILSGNNVDANSLGTAPLGQVPKLSP